MALVSDPKNPSEPEYFSNEVWSDFNLIWRSRFLYICICGDTYDKSADETTDNALAIALLETKESFVDEGSSGGALDS